VQSPIPVIGPDHVVYTFWFEGDGVLPGTNWLKMRKVENRGATLGDIQTIRQLVTTNVTYGNLELLRSNTSTNDDTFRAFPFPVPAANPAKTNHLYLAYADRGTNSGDKADVFFLCSTNGGANWTEPVQASTQWTNDQWMPVLAVKPDGTQLFLAWYDRRNDTNNSLIDLYGRFASLAANGEVNFSTNDFRITATNFAPVFAGTLTSNTNNGHYDPVYPPWQVNLHWWYPEWPAPPGNLTAPNARDHVGEYNGAWGDGQYVFLTWTDYRIPAADTLYARNQSDIRLVRIPWAVIRPLRMKTRKKTISTVGNGGLIALLAISTAFGQSGYWLNNYFNQGVNAPVFDAQGIPLAGTNYLAELWGGAMPDSLTPAVAFYSRQRVIVPFLIGLDAGYFVDSYANRSSADHPTVLSVPPYVAMAWLEVRAWDARLGSTYEQVVSLGLGG
jgi:hypothetical protein